MILSSSRAVVESFSSSKRVADTLATTTELGLSVLCIPEAMSAFNRRVREGSLNQAQYQQLKQFFLTDVADTTIINLSSDILDEANSLLEQHPLRAADALHVASAIVWGADRFLSADSCQLAAATASELITIDVSR